MSFFKYADAAVLWAALGPCRNHRDRRRFLVRPLLPKFRDDQVALYLEEHEKSLSRASVLTAVEMQGVRGA